MNNVERPDLFTIDALKGLSGPVQILKNNSRHSLINAPITQVLLSNDESSQSEHFTVWNAELDKWTTHGDIGYIDHKGKIRIVLSKLANANTLLVTERCDNLCLFCSQPPREVDDTILYAYAASSIVSFNTGSVIGISGGEPLLNRKAIFNFFDILNKFENKTPLHILTNGRAFKDKTFTKSIQEKITGREVQFGIPLYSTNSVIHDRLVNADNAWSETIKGLINAGNHGIPIELRIIPTQQNVHELSAIIEMAATSLNHISSISIMNLEQTGWARKNWEQLYLHPSEYTEQLTAACSLKERFKININLFNYPLCHIPEELHKHCHKSISDWKNIYPKECNYCIVKSKCCGFFSSCKDMVTTPIGRIL